MGFESAALRDLVGCSGRWAAGGSMVGGGQLVGVGWSRIARLHGRASAGA